MSDLQRLQELEGLLDEQNGILSMLDELLAVDPTDQESHQSKADTLSDIATTKSEIADLKRSLRSASKPSPAVEIPPPPPAHDDTPPQPPKYDMSKHPKYRNANAETPPPPPSVEDSQQVFNVRDTVMAKYSDDHQWYKATIISKTGSSTDPVYTVNFTEYGTIETKRKFEVRATETKKRKAEAPPSIPSPHAPTSLKAVSSGPVISAAPSVDPTLVQKREPSKVSDGPTRMAPEPKKLKGNKALDKAKSSWTSWQQNGPKKSALATTNKKDSQFRTPDLPNAKVGFTGSGKPMQKDQSKNRWTYGGGPSDEPIG